MHPAPWWRYVGEPPGASSFYVAARFEFSFGMGAVISLLHDVDHDRGP